MEIAHFEKKQGGTYRYRNYSLKNYCYPRIQEIHSKVREKLCEIDCYIHFLKVCFSRLLWAIK